VSEAAGRAEDFETREMRWTDASLEVVVGFPRSFARPAVEKCPENAPRRHTTLRARPVIVTSSDDASAHAYVREEPNPRICRRIAASRVPCRRPSEHQNSLAPFSFARNAIGIDFAVKTGRDVDRTGQRHRHSRQASARG
jgi:hypothetical protein